jgi:hypothetical protein
MPPLRQPAVAGLFYPDEPAALRRLVGELTPAGRGRSALGCVAPHAGYAWSGATAGKVFGAIIVPDLCVVLSPNHTGLGAALSVHPGGAWRTPLGDVPGDEALARRLVELYPELEIDAEAHREEHGVEVELPFLLVRNPAVRIIALVLATQDEDAMRRLGAALAALVRESAPGALLVASSDMNHFENDAVTREKDAKAIERLRARDPEGLLSVCARERISMCGVAPAAAVLRATGELGAREAELLDYRTSADAGGDRKRVVGYAGVLIS